MKRLFIPITLAVMLLAGAGCGKEGPSVKKSSTVGSDPIKAQFVERESSNVAYWAEGGWKSAVLVRFAGYDAVKPVPEDALAALKDMAAKGDYEGLAAAGDPASKDALYGPANAVYVAHGLGIVKQVYWVVPSFESLDENSLSYFKDYLKGVYPQDEAEIDAVSLDGKTGKGSVNGVPVRIVCLEDLEDPGEPVLIEIDVSFFQAMYDNEKQTPSLKFVAGMFELLSKSGLNSYAVSVSASGLDAGSALKFRWFPRYMAELFNKPGMIDAEPPLLWSERAEAWRMEQNDPETAVPLYKRIIERYPDDAATRYDLAGVYFTLGEYEACAGELEGAAGLDPAYGAAFGMYAELLAKGGRPKQAAVFRRGEESRGG